MKRKYLKQLSRYLVIEKNLKHKVIEELADDIQRREEDGETIEGILSSLGSPKDVASEFNLNLSKGSINIKYRVLIIVLSIVGVVSIVLAIHNVISILAPQLSVQYILTDLSDEGNRASFVAFKLSYKSVIIKILIEVLVSFIAFLHVLRIKKRISSGGGG